MLWLYLLGVSVVAYLIGSISTGYIAVKTLKGQDIREVGSGSTGATNVKRVLGKKWFFIVLLLDAIKGMTPVILATCLASKFGDTNLISPTLGALFVILGHSKPIFLNFRGGKSVASGVGTIIALSPVVGAIVAVIWAIITYVSKYVSLGSIIAVSIAPFLMFAFKKPISYVVYCALGAIYIIYLHRENIKRLTKGEENKVR
jgi:glycerol-3-phosphate acyltransferase PlsY